MTKQKTMTVADVLTAQLQKAGVKRIYGLIGDSLNYFGQCVKDSPLEWIGVRHEEVAAYAAAGEAELTGTLAVCAGTCGPGSIHLINGLYEANRNGVPVLAIASHIPSAEIGVDYFQATHPDRVFVDCSVFCELLCDASQLPRLLYEAIQTALTKKGVAVLVIPQDVMVQEMPFMPELRAPVLQNTRQVPSLEAVTELADILNHRQRIAFYCGVGCREAMPEVLELAEKLKAPIMYTMRAHEFAPLENPYSVGMNGYLATGSASTALNECDCLVMMGTDFPYDMLFPKAPTLVQIDIDGSHLGRRCRIDCGVVGDIKEVLDLLLPLIKNHTDRSFLDNSLAAAQKVKSELQQKLTEVQPKSLVNPAYLTSRISALAAQDALFLIDVGLNDKWAARYIEPKPHRRILGSFKHGTMAAAVGEAIGSSFVYPNRQIIVLAGDGGLSMLLGDLLTIHQYQRPIHIVVYNNQELGYINFEASLEGYVPFGTNLLNPDFSKVAESMGINGFHIGQNVDVDGVLNEAFSYLEPTVIDVATDPKALGVIQ